MTKDGNAVDEKEWRRQNLEWERRRREADKDAEFRHQREVDKRRARMCLRQQQREDDYRKKKAEKQQDASMAVKVKCFLNPSFKTSLICTVYETHKKSLILGLDI